MKKYTLWWYYHPDKDRAWYEEQKLRRSEDSFAREVDINYSLSISGKVFSSFREERHVCKSNPGYKKSLPVYRIWDFGKVNCVLYVQMDNYGRVRGLHERILGEADRGSTWEEQKHVAYADSSKLFPDASFYDICDPAGSWEDHRDSSPEVSDLQSDGFFPQYRRISELPTSERKKRGRTLIQDSLQSSPNGTEAFQLYCSPSGDEGCPILKKSFMGGYCYKKDASGNTLDKISERHPYEDVIDCLIYFYLETGGVGESEYGSVEPVMNDIYVNPFTGY